MLRVFIYEEEKDTALSIGHLLQRFFTQLKCSYELLILTRSADLAQRLAQLSVGYHVYLLDLDNPLTQAAAAEIRKQNLSSAILFFSQNTEKLLPCLLFRPSGYFLLPLDKQAFLKQFYVLYVELRGRNPYFVVRNQEQLSRIPYDQIEFFESNNKTVYLHTARSSRVFKLTAKLDGIEATLPKSQFLRCHQSFMLNMDHINRLDKTSRQFVLFSGKTVDISRRSYSEVVSAFEQYLERSPERTQVQ